MIVSCFYRDLLGDYEFDVELDYDENMDELDVAESPAAGNGTLTQYNCITLGLISRLHLYIHTYMHFRSQGQCL